VEDLYWLKNPIHENLIKFEMTEEFLSKVVKSFDGTIMAVKTSEFQYDQNDSEDILYKMGYKTKETVKKKRRGVYHNFIDTEEEFSERVISDMKS
jgi:hypothetical protein